MQPLGAHVKGVLKAATSKENGPVGVIYGATNSKGEVLVLEAAGKRSIADKADTMTTGNTTKMICNMAALQLVEQGKLKLDEPVEKLLPELANPQIIGADGKTSPAKNKITLRHLMSHTSGLSYSIFNHANVQYRQDHKIDFETTGDMEPLFAFPLSFEPGTDWQYGTNIDAVGLCVARASGKTLGEYLRTNIFEPLGIKDTAFQVVDRSRFASMHQRDENGKIGPGDHHGYVNKTENLFEAAGHGLLGTVSDYLKILTVLLNDGKGANGQRILSSASTKMMFVDQLAVLGIKDKKPLDRPIPAAVPPLTLPIQLMPGVTKGWSFIGVLTQDDLPTGRKAGACWWAGLSNNYFEVDPGAGIANFVMSQSFPFNDPQVLSIWMDAEKATYDSLK